jgi:hypothetical protein
MPKDHPQFPGDVEKHQNIKEGRLCVKCHDPHDPAAGEDEEREGDEDSDFMDDEW